MLYINLYDLCQNCLVLIIMTFWVQVLEGCLTEELGKEPVSGHRAELLERVPGPFPRGGSCQSWDRSHQKWRATYLESRQRKETACLCLIFLKWCGTDSPFVYMYFTAVRDWNQYLPLTLMDLHQVRRETWALCSLPMCYLLSLWDKSMRECLASPPVAGLFDLVLPDARALLWPGTSGNSSARLVPIQAAADCLTWKALCLVLTCRGDKISSVNRKLCLFGFNCGGAAELCSIYSQELFQLRRGRNEWITLTKWELCYLFVDNLCRQKRDNSSA